MSCNKSLVDLQQPCWSAMVFVNRPGPMAAKSRWAGREPTGGNRARIFHRGPDVDTFGEEYGGGTVARMSATASRL